MFKKGDIVICIENFDQEHNLEKGKLYKVLTHDVTVYIEDFPYSGFYARRFKLAKTYFYNKDFKEMIDGKN